MRKNISAGRAPGPSAPSVVAAVCIAVVACAAFVWIALSSAWFWRREPAENCQDKE